MTISKLVSIGSAVIEISVSLIAGKNIGNITGNNKIGKSPPLTVAEVVNAAINVPAADNPIVPSNNVDNSKKIFSTPTSNRIKNIGKIKIVSTASDKNT